MLVKVVHTVASMVLLLCVFSHCDTMDPPSPKIDVQVDIALLMEPHYFGETRQRIMKIIPVTVEIAEDKAKVGVWYFGQHENKTIVGLTGNVTHFTTALEKFTPGSYTGPTPWNYALIQTVNVFKATGRRGIPKIIFIFFVSPLESQPNSYAVEAEKAGLQVHLAVCYYNVHISSKLETNVIEYFPTARLFSLNYALYELKRLLCMDNKTTCTFDKSGACVSYGSGLVSMDPLECGNYADLRPKPCDKIKCEAFCDDRRQWPNITEHCAGKCGNITIQRNLTSGTLPQWETKMLSRCPDVPAEEKEVQCTCTLKSTVESSPSTAVWSTSASKRPKANLTKPAPASSFPWWAIVIAIVAVILLGIIVAVVVSRRRSVQKKSAAAAKKKGSAHYPTSSGKMEAKGRKMVVKGRKGVGAAIGEESGVAKGEESMGVSLQEDMTVKRVMVKGSSVKSSIKGKAEVSKKGTKKTIRALSMVVKGHKIATGSKKALSPRGAKTTNRTH